MLVNDIEIGVEHKPIKNIHLAVYPPDGRVHISAPMDVSDERLRLYAFEKMPWIQDKIDTLTSYKIQPPRENPSTIEEQPPLQKSFPIWMSKSKPCDKSAINTPPLKKG